MTRKSITNFSLFAFITIVLASGYYRNIWGIVEKDRFEGFDIYCQSQVIGRVIKAEKDGIFSVGGLTGWVRDDSVMQSMTWEEMTSFQFEIYKREIDLSPANFIVYDSQLGGQGMAFALLDRISPFSNSTNLKLFWLVTSLSLALILSVFIFWVFRYYGIFASLLTFFLLVISPWLTIFGRNLYLVVSSFYFPFIIMLFLLHKEYEGKSANSAAKLFLFSAGLVFIKLFLSGFEFITTALVMFAIPLFYYFFMNRWNPAIFIKRFSALVLGSISSIIIYGLLYAYQLSTLKGTFLFGINQMLSSFLRRTHGNSSDFDVAFKASLESNVSQVLKYYSDSTALVLGPINISFKILIIITIILSSLIFLPENFSATTFSNRRKNIALLFTTWISILAPLSWFIIFKAHSFVHLNYDSIVWYMPFCLFSFALIGSVASSLIKDSYLYLRTRNHIMNRLMFMTCMLAISCLPAFSQAPPLREQLSLNGTWSFTDETGEKSTIPVPEYWDAAPGFTKKVSREYTNDRGEKTVREVLLPSTSIGIYERDIAIPEAWKNKIIKLEFEGINHIAEVYLNDKLLETHIGGWTPFEVDITGFIKPGSTGRLKVLVKGGSHSPIVDANGYPQWPVGWYGQESRWGIIFDTWLRAYGAVHIEDAFIQTSWRKKELAVNYTLVNKSSSKQEIFLLGEVREKGNSKTELRLTSDRIVLKPGEKKMVQVKSVWENPKPWNPETPDLYFLVSKITRDVAGSSEIIDEEQRRFGFREIWIDGTKLMLNGNRLNLRGTSINTHGQGYNRGRYKYITEETFNHTIDRLQFFNINCVRFHQQPPSKRIIEIADERGLLVVEESPMYARDYILKSNNEVYFSNALTWLKPWIKDRRNHPSVIMWSSENEIGRDWLKWFSDKQLKTLADSIRAIDPTRPVIAEGDFDIGDDFYSDHYPEGVGKTVKGSIYSWDTLISKTKPSSFGEFLYGNSDGKEWWHGTWCRGLRYINAAQIMPYTLDWAWTADSIGEVHENLKNSFAPVALFDKDYDDLGIDVLRKKLYPELKEGKNEIRTLVLYNDCYTAENVQVEVRLENKGILLANNIINMVVPLGEHREFKCEFPVPPAENGTFDLVLITRKNGKLKFRETRSFKIIPDAGSKMTEKLYLKILKD